MKAGSVWLTVALAMAINACGSGSETELGSTTTVDPLLAIEESSGFSRDDPPNQNVYDLCRINGSAGIANQLGLDPTLYPDGFPHDETARAYVDRVAPLQTEEVRVEVYVSCLFGFGGTD